MLYLALGFMIPSDPVGLVLERMLHTKCCTPYITFNARAKLKKKQIKQDLVYTCHLRSRRIYRTVCHGMSETMLSNTRTHIIYIIYIYICEWVVPFRIGCSCPWGCSCLCPSPEPMRSTGDSLFHPRRSCLVAWATGSGSSWTVHACIWSSTVI